MVRGKIRGHHLMENGLVGEIRTRMIVVAVRCITFLPPRDLACSAGQCTIYSMCLDKIVRSWLMQNERGHCTNNPCRLGQQHEPNDSSNERENLLNGESSPASVSTAVTRDAPARTLHQTNQGTSILADAALCARLRNLEARHLVRPN